MSLIPRTPSTNLFQPPNLLLKQDDFRQLVREIDEKQILELKQNLNELKNHYASVYDLLYKNYDKIKKPKSSNVSIMF